MSDYKVAERLVTFLGDERKLKKLAIMYQDDTSGDISKGEVEKRAKAHGMDVVAIENLLLQLQICVHS